MSDRQILNVLEASVETYENLTEEGYDEDEDYDEDDNRNEKEGKYKCDYEDDGQQNWIF